MSKKISLTLILSLILISQFSAFSQADAEETVLRDFRNFSGVCHGNIQTDYLWDHSLGWDRFDLSWEHLEPQAGEWNQQRLENFAAKRVLPAKDKKVNFLPILDYVPPWAAGDIPDQEFVLGQIKYKISQKDDGNFEMQLFNLIGQEEKLFSTRKIDAKRMSRRYLAAEHVPDWENYVRKVVTFLRSEPYNLEYFQIWNEAHPTSSFWYGDMDVYMQRVHLPAAKIIHELGGKVVFGGWICGAPLQQLVDLLDKNQAWQSIDILDIHYYPLAGMEYLYRETSRRGLEHLGIWQTELGFTADANFIGNNYPRMLYWGLSNNWSYPDKYKSFYFAYSSPDDVKAYGYRRSLLLGKNLNLSGKSLDTLGQLLSGGELQIYQQVQSSPQLVFELDERLSSMESFQVGNRIITACHVIANNNAKLFVNWHGDLDAIHLDYDNPLLSLNYPELGPDQIAKIERISMYGSRLDISGYILANQDSKNNAKDSVTVLVPIREPDSQEFKYVDMPENFLPQVFYIVTTLRDDN